MVRVPIRIDVGVAMRDHSDHLQDEKHADQAQHHQERQVPPVIEEPEKRHGPTPADKHSNIDSIQSLEKQSRGSRVFRVRAADATTITSRRHLV
jgi:hypothetical protein